MATAIDLIEAVNAGDAIRVGEILAQDPALVAARDAHGVSALMLARYRFDREVTDVLLAADPELDVFEAAALGYVDRLRERLLDDPAAGATFSTDGFTALHFAAFFGKAEAARLLLEHGAGVDVYTRNPFASQPLHEAAQHGDVEMTELFLSAGADPTATADDGNTPAAIAAAAGHIDLATRLREVGFGTGDH